MCCARKCFDWKLKQSFDSAFTRYVKLSHVYYNLTIYVLHTNQLPLRNDCLLMSGTKTNWRTDREQYTRSNAARLLTLVKPAETKARDWPRNSDVNNHIAEHHLQMKHQIDWDSVTCITYSIDYYQRLTLESWFTNLEQTPLNHSQQLPTTYKWLIDKIKQD